MVKRLLCTMLLLAVLVPAGAWCQTYKVVGHAEITVNPTSGVSLVSVPSDATTAVVSVYGDTLCWRMDGVDPTSVNGMVLADGSYYPLLSQDEMAKFRAVLKSGGAGATVFVTYKGVQ